MINVLNRTLEEVRPVIQNDVNEVSVYKDIKTNNMFVLIKLINRELTKQIVKLIYDSDGKSLLPSNLFIDSIVYEGNMLLIFNYLPERRLFSYLKAESTSSKSTIKTIKNLIINYFALKVETPIAALLINENNINLKQDGTIYFGAILDFKKINLKFKEEDSTKLIIDLINKILLEFDMVENKQYKNLKSTQLFFKKYKKNMYNSLIEVYNDFKIDDNVQTYKIFDKLKSFFKFEKFLSIGKWILIITAIFMFFIGVKFLLEKSTFMIGLKNNNLNSIGTVDMKEKQK